MITLFEQDIKTNDRQSSKGNQLKWLNGDTWYKADYAGYEGLAEYMVSELIKHSNASTEEIKQRVLNILIQQRRKYQYLFLSD